MALEDPSPGQKRASDELRQREISISAAGVRCVWLSHNLETFDKRLKALEEHVARTGDVLTDAQLRALDLLDFNCPGLKVFCQLFKDFCQFREVVSKLKIYSSLPLVSLKTFAYFSDV